MNATYLLANDVVPETEETDVLAFSGATIDTSGATWRLSADSVVRWQPFEEVPEAVWFSLRAYIRCLVATSSPAHAQNQLEYLNRLGAREIVAQASDDLSEVGFLGLQTYHKFAKALAGPVSSEHHVSFLGAYIRWYVWSVDSGLYGFDEDVASSLDAIVLKAAPKGAAVLRQDPKSGPLRKSEYEAFEAALRSPKAERLTLKQRVVAWLFLCFGCNPRSLSLIAEEDFISTKLGDGSEVFELRIPRIKKRTPGERDQFRTRTVIPELASQIRLLLAENRLEKSAAGEFRPLIRGSERKSLVGTAFAHQRFRTQVSYFGQALRHIANSLDLRAHDGGALHLTPRRLRYTFATKLVAIGASPQEVADALDHSDTGTVMVYFNSRSDVVTRLDKAMGLALAPIAQAFMGVVIDDETGATRARDKASRIKHYSPTLKSLEPVGSCGSFGFCGLMAPIACYTCSHFQAWLDGPHEQVFDELERRRNERLAAGADPKMTQIHDRTMLAIAEVITRCAARRSGEG